MSKRQAVPAVATANRRLDQAGTVAVTAGRQRQEHVARVPVLERPFHRRRADGIQPRSRGMLRNRFAYEIAECRCANGTRARILLELGPGLIHA